MKESIKIAIFGFVMLAVSILLMPITFNAAGWWFSYIDRMFK